MKTTRRSVLVLAALLATPFALHADEPMPAPAPALDPAPGEVNPATGALVTPDVVVSQNLNRSDAVNARLVTGSATASIKSSEFATRDQAIALAQRASEEGRAITTALRTGARVLGDEPRKDVELALVKADQARERLNQALSRARDSSEQRWKDVRDDLAERYEQYAEALEDARKLAVDRGVKFEEPRIVAAP